MTIKGKFAKGLAGILIGATAFGSGCAGRGVYEPGVSESGVSESGVSQRDYNQDFGETIKSIEGNIAFQRWLGMAEMSNSQDYQNYLEGKNKAERLMSEKKVESAREDYFDSLLELSISFQRNTDEWVNGSRNPLLGDYIHFLISASKDLFDSKRYEDSFELSTIYLDNFAVSSSTAEIRTAENIFFYSKYYLGITERESYKVKAKLLSYDSIGSMGGNMTVDIGGETQEISYGRGSTVILNSEEELFKKGQKLEIWLDNKPIDGVLPLTKLLKVGK